MPGQLYDWDEIFEQSEQEDFKMVRGTHYTCTQSSIIQQIRNAASRRGLVVHVKDKGTSVVIQVLGNRNEGDE